MVIEKVLILDDITSLAELITDQISKAFSEKVSVDLCSTEQDFVKKLELYPAENTLVMVNAAFKPQEAETYRYKLNGIVRIVKLCLRITWQKLHPVIVYGILPEEELRKSAIGSIFTKNQNHRYLNLTQINETRIKSSFELSRPVASISELRLLITELCKDELYIYLKGAAHLLLKTNKLEEEIWREKFIDRLERLDKIIPDEYINKLFLRTAIRQLKYFKPNNFNSMIDKINHVREKITELMNKISEVANNVSP